MSYGAPEQIEPKGLGDYLEVMSKAVFQSGMSWKVINGKWPGIHDAFRGFEPLAVASLTEAEMADLAADTRMGPLAQKRRVSAVAGFSLHSTDNLTHIGQRRDSGGSNFLFN